MILNSDWTVIKSLENGGEILAMDDGNIRVSFPDDISEDIVRDALRHKNIEVSDNVVFESGEAEGETVAFFLRE
jgi:hypothetical protein